jgi:copper chaperone CopZ
MIAFRPQGRPSIAFQVDDMTCLRSAGAITNAVKEVDRGARVRVVLTTRRVEIEPSRAGVEAIGAAINRAGYTPVPVASRVSGDE